MDKDVKRKTKADNRTFVENLADKAETAAQMQNMAILYNITKALAGGFKNRDIPMKYADGVVITIVEEQTQLCKTYFETILNNEAPKELEDITERDEYLLVNMDTPTANEVKSAIDNMKSGAFPDFMLSIARSRRHKCRDAESGRRRHHRNPYRDFKGNIIMARRRNTRRLEDRTYR